MPIDTGLVTHVIPLVIAYSIIVVLFLKNRRDLKRLRAEAQESARTAAAGVSHLSLQMEGIRASVRQMEEAPVAALPGQGINLNKRAQALRMYKRGETIPSIAAALRTPTHEVQLLLKVHHLLNG
ncbi:MAG TPA: hypothetical protein VML19_35255 [Verrucomicrobiae bacterium]|nr:hypothetical protein [Verrucomicrobiae bacterium]